MKKLLAFWKKVPRVIQYLLAGIVITVVKQKVPGIIPDDITPDKILAGGAGLALLHHLEDKNNANIGKSQVP